MDNNIFTTINWSTEDLEDIFQKNNISFTEENIQKFLDANGDKVLHERSVEEGWVILEDIVTNMISNSSLIEDLEDENNE